VAQEMIIFDMDGVLVDVTESYRETIVRTVQHFTGQTIERSLIQQYKNAGGWNNDWALSQKIAADLGTAVDYPVVVDYFQKIFYGDGDGGLMAREQWIARPGVLEALAQRYAFSIFTGRERAEAQMTLDRFAQGLTFAPIVGADDVQYGKPDPEGMFQIISAFPGHGFVYIGDTVDDARSAKLAGVPFIGIGHGDTGALLLEEGAKSLIPSINDLEGALATL
jgi:HAD superfamily hydrolase (TIGR01548 family)